MRGPGLLHFPARAPSRLEMLLIVASLTIITKEKDNVVQNIASSAFFSFFFFASVISDTYVFSCPMPSHSPNNNFLWWSLNEWLMQPNSWNKKIPEVSLYGVKT